MTPPLPDATATPSEQRRTQILEAAVACFARRGIHQTTMQDISHEAGISVGLIYRYFESKEQVIAAMAREHLAAMKSRLDEARRLPGLSDALECALFCDQRDEGVAASFVVELFAESARNPPVRALVREIHEAVLDNVTNLIASSPESQCLAPGLSPRDAATLVFQAIHGEMFDEILRIESGSVRAHRSEALRRISSILFFPAPASAGSGPKAARDVS